MSEIASILRVIVDIVEERNEALDLIREVAVSGVEIESRQYVTVQISPETWAKIQEVARG